MKIGMELECVRVSNAKIVASSFEDYSIGTDGAGFLVELRSEVFKRRDSMYASILKLINTITTEQKAVILQHPDYASGLHVHVDDKICHIREEYFKRLTSITKKLQSYSRDKSIYSSEINLCKIQDGRIEFRFMPSSVFAMKNFFSELVRLLRIYTSLPKSLRPLLLSDEISNNIIDEMYKVTPTLHYHIISIYEKDIPFSYSNDIFVCKPEAYSCIPIRIFGLAEERGENIITIPSSFHLQPNIKGINIIHRDTLSFGLSKDIRICRNKLEYVIRAIEEFVNKNTISAEEMKNYDNKLYKLMLALNKNVTKRLKRNK